MEITENGAEIKLQALLDHSVERILLDVNSVDRSHNEEQNQVDLEMGTRLFFVAE